MKLMDYIIIGFILLALFWAVRTVKRQKGSCGCDCSSCRKCNSCKKKIE